MASTTEWGRITGLQMHYISRKNLTLIVSCTMSTGSTSSTRTTRTTLSRRCFSKNWHSLQSLHIMFTKLNMQEGFRKMGLEYCEHRLNFQHKNNKNDLKQKMFQQELAFTVVSGHNVHKAKYAGKVQEDGTGTFLLRRMHQLHNEGRL
jgi:hypothetical protein